MQSRNRCSGKISNWQNYQLWCVERKNLASVYSLRSFGSLRLYTFLLTKYAFLLRVLFILLRLNRLANISIASKIYLEHSNMKFENAAKYPSTFLAVPNFVWYLNFEKNIYEIFLAILSSKFYSFVFFFEHFPSQTNNIHCISP